MNLENIPFLRMPLRKKRIQAASVNLKKDFLSRWSNEGVMLLCKDKGIATTKIIVEQVNTDNPVPITPIPYRELIDIIAKSVPAKELISFCEQHGIECEGFKRAFNTLLTELNNP